MLLRVVLRDGRSPIFRLTVGLFAAFFAFASGCSGDKPALVPVKGSVKVKGEPAKGAVVLFHPQDNKNGQPASGIVADDGSFTLSTGVDAGLLPGTYKVTVTWPDPSAPAPTEQERMMGMVEDGPDLLKGKYANPAATSLSVEISSGKSELPPFELEAP